jgi:hypothetical protein
MIPRDYFNIPRPFLDHVDIPTEQYESHSYRHDPCDITDLPEVEWKIV